jgi:hypothetical protein
MVNCHELLETHLENHGAKYYVFIALFQSCYFLTVNLKILVKYELEVSSYEYYEFVSLSLLLGSMLYFLY